MEVGNMKKFGSFWSVVCARLCFHVSLLNVLSQKQWSGRGEVARPVDSRG